MSDQPAGTMPEHPAGAPDPAQRARLAAIADHLIPEAHGMPSAAAVLDDARLRFVLRARPDLLEPLLIALRGGPPDDPVQRLAQLEREETAAYGSLLLVIVGGYYADPDVRKRIGYPGQEAKQVYAWQYPPYLEEGLIDAVLARGPVWKDPSTGRRAETG